MTRGPGPAQAAAPACRACGTALPSPFLDLGAQPLSNDYVAPDRHAAAAPQAVYPLRVRSCPSCTLVQCDDAVPADAIFNEHYAYFSSFSESWLAHCRRFASAARARFGLGPQSHVIEVASNDGYLLQYFQQAAIPVLGIEPSESAAQAARARGIPTETLFFGSASGRALRDRGISADLIYAANVLAHVPDLADFLAGFPFVLAQHGTVTLEFPHLLNLIEQTQFDTIYHEHYSYVSLLALERALKPHGLVVYDVERWPTHGGSLRVFCGLTAAGHPVTDTVAAVRTDEIRAGLNQAGTLAAFAERVSGIVADFNAFLRQAGADGKRIAAYGAAAKGNTFLNSCGVTARDILCAFDRNPHKQGKLLPGSLIPIQSPDEIAAVKPDYIVILPWNIREEIQRQLAFTSAWNARFVTAVPKFEIVAP